MRRYILIIAIIIGVFNTMSAQKRIISTTEAPKAIGPYNQAVAAGNMLFASGQLGIDPATGNFVPGGVKEQTEQALKNLKAVVVQAGFTMAEVVSCTVYLKNMNDFPVMNGVYATYFPADAPSRATVEVARLPKDGIVEISCIAVKTP